MRNFWRPILFGTLVTVVLFSLGGIFSAGGHNFALMMIFFPWAMMLSGLSSYFGGLPFALLVGLQFPFYGITIGVGHEERFFRWAKIGLVTLVHILAVVWCFVFDVRESWRILKWG